MRILLVEDNPADVKITQRAFQEGRVASELHVVGDGQEALDYLHRRGAYSQPDQAPEPDLILLDLNLPGLHGCEVLARIKQDPHLRDIPVVVLTTSDNARDVQRAYRAGANTYIQKPVEFDVFVDIVSTLQRYWADIARLPRRRLPPRLVP